MCVCVSLFFIIYVYYYTFYHIYTTECDGAMYVICLKTRKHVLY